jgi:hypothetical protein
VDAAPVRAEGRPVAVAGTALQNHFSVTVLESINVGTDQVADAQRWKTTASGNSSMTLMIELASTRMAMRSACTTPATSRPRCSRSSPGTAVAGQYAMASFRPLTSQLLVTLFNGDGTGRELRHAQRRHHEQLRLLHRARGGRNGLLPRRAQRG